MPRLLKPVWEGDEWEGEMNVREGENERRGIGREGKEM